MATNVLPPMANSSFEQGPTDNNVSTNNGTGLRRGNTLKSYLASKNKLKERRAINVIVDPTILQQTIDESSGSEEEPFTPLSPSNLTSPIVGRRIDSDLDVIDEEKKKIEEQLTSITSQLSQSTHPDESSLVEERTRLCQELNTLLKKRRELLESWTRDYKNLKRSGSLARRKEDPLWVTTA